MSVNCCFLLLIASISGGHSQKFSSSPSTQYYCEQQPDTCCNPCYCSEYIPVCPCQQVSNSPVYTTIIDNSVSNALANALQLLIVSNLIESSMAARGCKKVLEDPECDGQVTEIVYDVPCGPVLDLPPDETEIINSSDLSNQTPCLAEALFPSSIPAQLVCNFGYTEQPKPCVRFNVNPVSDIKSCASNKC